MKTLRNELNSYRTFVTDVRHSYPETKERKRTTENVQQAPSRSTGGSAANKRYKRTPEELDSDIHLVDELVAGGKFNQIEALNEVGLQSSVYHYRKRQWKDEPAKSLKPRKFAHRNRSTASDYATRKQELFTELDKPVQKAAPVVKEDGRVLKLEQQLQELQNRYNKLKDYVVENVVMK